jgi:uncharacterized protein
MNISHPHGITVFGSSIVRLDPDLVMIRFSVSSTQPQPADAFQKTRFVAQQVESYLSHIKAEDVGMSRLSLSSAFEYRDGKNHFVGYEANIDFVLLLRDLDQTERILVDLVGLGINHITRVDYQTSRLKEIRAQARQKAVQAAREKAELYCQAAGVKLGRVLHIEDVNPDQLRGREGHGLHLPNQVSHDEGDTHAFNPAGIVVGGAVMMAFEIA